MDKSSPRQEALLIDEGIIVAVGKLSDIEALTDTLTEKVDLDGKTLMPSFVDGHSHVVMFGAMINRCDLSECKSFDEILSVIADYREKNNLTHGEKINCHGYDLSVLKEGRHPTADVLDRLGGDNPIGCTHASLHRASRRNALYRNLDFGFLVSPELKKKIMLFPATTFVVICYDPLGRI